MNPSEQNAIQEIKKLSGFESKDFVFTAGEGVLINGSGKNWSIQADPAYNQKAGKTYTIQICVDGSPMNLDVYAAGPPY